MKPAKSDLMGQEIADLDWSLETWRNPNALFSSLESVESLENSAGWGPKT